MVEKMIKLQDIVREIINEGGKAFGNRAKRMTTVEMQLVFGELKSKIGNAFGRFEIAKSLPSKNDHGDLDIVVINNNGLNVFDFLKQKCGNSIEDTLKSGNINSFLYKSIVLGHSVHVDIITVGNVENFDAQYEYLSYGDFSGILGVMSRKLKFKYGTEGMFKIYVDKKNRYHDILLTKNLKDGLKMLGYTDFHNYENIKTLDDIVDFISTSPLFDSDYYKGLGFNNSDRKRCRIGRPSADYIRNKLSGLNKHSSIVDSEHFLKTLFPDIHNKMLLAEKEIEKTVVSTKVYNGNWIMQSFPSVKPGPIISKIMNNWKEIFGDTIDSQSEETMLKITREFLGL